jgi:hypothetical protein
MVASQRWKIFATHEEFVLSPWQGEGDLWGGEMVGSQRWEIFATHEEFVPSP